MNAIEQRLTASDPVRDEDPLLTDEVASAMLAAILQDDRAPRRSPRRKVAIGAATLSLALAGTALAAGGIPDVIRDHLTSMNDPGRFPIDVAGVRQVASVKDGSDVLELYQGPGPYGGRCQGVVSRSPSGDYSDETGMECARGDALASPASGLSVSASGDEVDGYTIYGDVPRKAALVELRVPGQPARSLVISNGHIIARTGPAAFSRGYEIVARDRSGEVIGRQREAGD